MAVRKIWPSDKDKATVLNPTNKSFNMTEEAYNAIIEAIEAANVRITGVDGDLQAYKDALASEIDSHLGVFDSITVNDRADIVKAVVDNLTATAATIPTLTSTDFTTVDLTAARAAIDEIVNVTSADIATVNATTVNADEGNFTSLHVDTLDADSYQIEQAAISDLTSESIQAEEITAARASIDDITAADITTTDATITNATIDKAELTDNYSQRIFNVYFNHNKVFNRQVIDSASVSADGDCWCVLPKFKNGHFYLIAKNGTNGPFLWSLEINNSIKNCMFRWSNADGDYQYLKDVEIIDDDNGYQFIQIHFNTNSLATHIFFQCTDYETHEPPSYYAVKQFDGVKNFEFTRNNGTYLPNSIFAGEFHAETLEIDQVEFDNVAINKHITLPNGYDQYGAPTGHTTGMPGDYVTPIIDEYNNEGITWKEPIKANAPTKLGDTDTLVAESAVSNYTGEQEVGITYTDAYTDGTDFYDDDFVQENEPEGEITSSVTAGDYIYYGGVHYKKTTSETATEYYVVDHFSDVGTLVEDPTLIAELDLQTPVTYTRKTYKTSSSVYNIKHLGGGTTTHGDHEIERDLTVDRHFTAEDGNVKLPNLYNGTEADMPALADNSLVIFTEVNDPSDYVANKLYRYRIGESLEVVLEEIIADSGNKDDQKPIIYDQATNAYKTTDSIDIGEGKFDTVFTRDLHVSGTAYIDDQKEQEVIGNFITLRANNSSAMTSGEMSGFLVNNYDTGKICAVVVDNTGTARVGNATGTPTTYANLYLSAADDKYYTDIEDPTTEVTPTGVMVSWDTVEKTDEYTHWTNAVWKDVTFTETEPILTRDESVDMDDKALIQWNATDEKAQTIPLPTVDEQTLTAHVVPGTVTYEETTITLPAAGETETYTDVYYNNNGTYEAIVSISCDDSGTVYTVTTTEDTYTESTVTAYEQVTADPEISYQWKEKQPGVLRFPSVAAYEAYAATHNVPEGSLVVIDNETSWVFGQEIGYE